MSGDEIFILALVIGSVIAVVSIAVQARRAKASATATAAKDVSRGEEPAPAAPRQTTTDRRRR
jgi:hypothetical protein